MARKTKEQKRKDKKVYDSFFDGYSPEELREIDDGEICGEEIVNVEDLDRFGSLFNLKYPKLRERYHPVRAGALELHWIERNVFFNLGAAFIRRLANGPKPDQPRGK